MTGSIPPRYILDNSSLQALHPEAPEQHGVEGWSSDTSGWEHCLNPKCGHPWTPQEQQEIEHGGTSCPQCGYYNDRKRLEAMGPHGGVARAGITMTEQGRIGEEIVNRMGEIPGVGPITWRSQAHTYPIDLRVLSQTDGVEYGVEVKSINSQSEGYFWAGTPRSNQAVMMTCMKSGLKPAMVGVRLNFFNDKANIFWRTGLCNTWIGNPKMLHVATVDFSDLNPFKTPEQKDALLNSGGGVDTNADSYNFNSDLDDMFGPATQRRSWNEQQHPRDAEGRFVVKKDMHELVVKDSHGKHQHTIKRCKHCHFTYMRKPNDQGRIECPTCGEDPERMLRLTSVVLGKDPVREMMLANSWAYGGRTAKGHHSYRWTGPDGTKHTIITGQTNNPAHVDMTMIHSATRKQMAKCMSGECAHPPFVPDEIQEGTLDVPLIKAGQEVTFGDGRYWVLDIEGQIALIYDGNSGAEDVVPVTELRAVGAAADPEWMFCSYLNRIIVKPWHHNLRGTDLLDELLNEIGSLDLSVQDSIDPHDVVIGVVRGDDVRIDSVNPDEAVHQARENLREWLADDKQVGQGDEWEPLADGPSDWFLAV